MATKKGKYQIINKEKYIGDVNNIIYRSSWEKKFMEMCDTNKNIIKWKSEGFPINYVSPIDQKVHKYFIDFFIQIRGDDGKLRNLAIEIKPATQTQIPKKNSKRFLYEMQTFLINQAKWRAADMWARQAGFKFAVITENEL